MTVHREVRKCEPRARITHELKSWPEFFEHTWHGRKTFELRKNDRDYQVGDQLLLKEWDPTPIGTSHSQDLAYTGRFILVRVDYIMAVEQMHNIMGHVSGEHPGICPDYVIMSISLVS